MASHRHRDRGEGDHPGRRGGDPCRREALAWSDQRFEPVAHLRIPPGKQSDSTGGVTFGAIKERKIAGFGLRSAPLKDWGR